MTGQPGEINQFDLRSDNAALRLRQEMQQQGADIPNSRAVEVDASGNPPAPPPPEGSYARQAYEQQRAAAEQQAAAALQQQGAAPTPTVGYVHPVNGEQPQAQQVPPQAQIPQGVPAEPAPELSENAQRRISDLTEKLRTKDREYQEALARAEASAKSQEGLKTQFEQLQSQFNQMVESNLEHLPPEERLVAMQGMQLQQATREIEQRIMGQLAPTLQSLQERTVHADLDRLASKYPRFDMGLHSPLIDTFRQQNPQCSVEQAYRAVATEPGELVTRDMMTAPAVPPTIPPGAGPTARYANPEPQPQSNPEQELIEETRRIRELRSSGDPAKMREGERLVHSNLAARLGHMLPGQ